MGSPEQRDGDAPESRATVDLGIDSTSSGDGSTGFLGFSAAFVAITVLSAALLRARSV